MMAKRAAGILPPLDFEEALEVTAIHSVVRSAALRASGSSARVRSARRITPCRTSRSRAADRSRGRGDQPRAPRRAVPGRDAGVQPARAGGAAPAARGRRRPHRPRAAHRGVSRAVRADRRDEPLPMRVPGRSAASVPVHADANGSLRVAAVGPAARSHRSDRHGVGAAAGGADVMARTGSPRPRSARAWNPPAPASRPAPPRRTRQRTRASRRERCGGSARWTAGASGCSATPRNAWA